MRLPFAPALPRSATLIGAASLLCAAGLSTIGAVWAVTLIERQSAVAVAGALAREGADWAQVRTDGLQVHLTGTAPTEARRLRALNAAGSVVDASRLTDAMAVAPARPVAAPRFSVELLRNDDGISVIGLVPAEPSRLGRAQIVAELSALPGGAGVTDMLETAAHAVPEGWDRALRYGIAAVKLLPRSKISIAADRVAITAISGSAVEQARLEAELAALRPEGLEVASDISAPRPVITPFALRFVIDAQGARLEGCSADTEAARATILEAAARAGLKDGDCAIGLGVPAPGWAGAVATGIAGLVKLGAGTLTFSDADVSLVAGPGVAQPLFDRVAGELDARLPDGFSLTAVKPAVVTAEVSEGPPEFTAALDAEGQVQMRGRLGDARMRGAVDSFARAAFGADAVHQAARLDPGLPEGWPLRVLAGLAAMQELQQGNLVVRPDLVEISGVTGNPQGGAAIARLLSDRLGQGQDFRIAVRYDKTFDPAAALPTPAECGAGINAALARQKITFEPGSATFAPSANMTLDAIAQVLRKCPDVAMEVAGHTDAQGRDEMNLSLSQSRAQAVIDALRARRVLVGGLTARGFGETRPVADNATAEGREANRRIEFSLLGPAGDVAGLPMVDAEKLGTPEAPVVVQAATADQTRPRPRPDAD